MRRSTYCVKYRLYGSDKEHLIDVVAGSAYEAYDKATYEVIPEKEGEYPYSSWVYSVTYNNGNCHHFNTCEGLAY